MTSLLIQHLITTTLLASLVLVVCRLAKPAPAARHILWSLVLLKLMIPPMGEMKIDMPYFSVLASVATDKTPARQAPRPPVHVAASPGWEGEAPAEPTLPLASVEQIIPTTDTESITSIAPIATTSPIAKPIETKTIPPLNWTALAIAAWLIGAFAMAALQLFRWQRFTAQTSVSAETPSWLTDEATNVAERLGRKAVPVVVCNRLSTPAVAGVLKPRILVPSALLDRLPRERWRALLTHELAHVTRRDTWWRMLELACGIVWFWNPVFWFARKNARNAAEHACDAWVVWAMPDQRRAYADSLVDVSEWASSPSLPATAIGMSAASRAKLEARLTSIVTGSARHRVSKPVVAIAALLLIAAMPGWALESRNTTESLRTDDSSTKDEIVLAQAETRNGAKKTRVQTKPKSDRVAKALKEPVSLEFDDEHVQTILEYLSEYVGVNIVLDHSVVGGEEAGAVPTEMDVVHVGPHWFRQPNRQQLGSPYWPSMQAVDGMVGPLDGDESSAKEVLDKLLPDAGMTYAITPDCVWITVAKPQFEIGNPSLKPETWAWYPLPSIWTKLDEPVNGLLNFVIRAPGINPTLKKYTMHDKGRHIVEVVAELKKVFDPPIQPDGSRVSPELPPIIVDALAIAPPNAPIPRHYLIESDSSRVQNLRNAQSRNGTRRGIATASTGVKVTSGNVPFIKLSDVPLRDALTALLRPLNLTYRPGPGFIYISSQERVEVDEFSDSRVPSDQIDLGKALNEPTTIEFDDEHVGTILEFLSEYQSVNIVVDSRAVIPEDPSNYSDTGTNPVTDGHVPYIKVRQLRFADTLKALLTPLNLDYSVGPGFIWVSSPAFIAAESKTASAKPARMPGTRGGGLSPTPVPAGGAPIGPTERHPAAAPVEQETTGPPARRMAVNLAQRAWNTSKLLNRSVTIDCEDEHVSEILEKLSNAASVAGILRFDARAAESLAVDSSRASRSTGNDERKLRRGGVLPYLRLVNVSLRQALDAVVQPLGLTYVVQPEFIIVTTRELAKARLYYPIELAKSNEVFGEHNVLRRLRVHQLVLSSDAGIGVKFDLGGKHLIYRPGDKFEDCELIHINQAANQILILQNGMPYVVDLEPKPPVHEMPRQQPKTEVSVSAEAATVTRAKKQGVVVDAYRFRRITRWEDSDARVEVEFDGGRMKWFEIGDTFQHIQIADIDVISNQVVINYNGELRVLQLSWPVQEGVKPKHRPKRSGGTTSRWTWTEIPYGNVKFGPIARWENSDPRLQVEFPSGERKWLEVGDAIGNARIGNINIIANQVVVRTPENETHTFDLPRPVQVSSAAAPRAKSQRKFEMQATWTPVSFGGITFGRLARWKDNGDAMVEVELSDGEHVWIEVNQSIADMTVTGIDVVKNQVTVRHRGAIKVVQLPWPAHGSDASPAGGQTSQLNPRDESSVGVGEQRWIDYIGDWKRPQ